jgi:hypothetical protein
MEASEAKPASRRARLWARRSDPDQLPRRWWFPPSSRRDEVFQMLESARQDYQKVVQQAHEKFSETVRLAMLSLLGFALFCLLITFSTPGSSLLVADPTIKMPFADVQVSFQSFLILAPFLLIVISLYLHIFYGYWLNLETDLQDLTLSRGLSEQSIERLPTLFSLDHPVPRLLTAFTFYWLVPLVLLVMTWKAAARMAWGVPLILFTGLVTVVLVFLQVRRCFASQRKRNRLRWAVMGLIVSGMATIMVLLILQLPIIGEFSLPGLPRPLNIVRADLKGKWLTEVNLRDADASFANLEGADLRGANLREADLQNADFQGADLRGVGLQKVEGLTEEQLQSARTDENTKLPPHLKVPRPAEPGAAAPPQEGTAQNK